MDTITEEQYRKVLKHYDEIVKLIIAKTTQLALIQWGRVPKGECYETDFSEEDGKLIVQFESYSCGEPDFDTYYLPLEFLFDENYPEKYKVLFKEEQRKKEKEKTRKIAEDQKMKEEEIESFDKREYERLKAKFEGK